MNFQNYRLRKALLEKDPFQNTFDSQDGKCSQTLLKSVLEIKKQNAKNHCLFLRINCSKQCTHDFFRG